MFGLIAGGGDLPQILCDKALHDKIVFPVVALEGTSAISLKTPILQAFPVAKAGAILSFFKQHNVKKLIICGSLKRPNFLTLIPDAKGLAFIAKVALKSLGDDALLKTVRAEIESEGFEIISVQDFMPELLVNAGSLSNYKPSIEDELSVTLGWNAAEYHGRNDLGQSIVVQNETILALEDQHGTDDLIHRASLIKQSEGRKPILIKRAKPQQDMALDVPTIGIQTIDYLIQHDFAGLVIESNRTLVLNQSQLRDRCNQYGLFFEVRN